MIKRVAVAPSSSSQVMTDPRTVGGRSDQTANTGTPKVTQVLPASFLPRLHGLVNTKKRRLRRTNRCKVSFYRTFGLLGPPILLILVLCLTWTVWLIFVLLEPNQAANWFMNTGSYDNGQFWLIIDSNPALTKAGVAGLVVVSLDYLLVILKTTVWRGRNVIPAVLQRLENRLLDSWNLSRYESKTWTTHIAPRYARKTWQELSSFSGRKRKVWVSYTVFSLAY